MKDRKYKISLELFVDKTWVEDGLYSDIIKRRIKEELPTMLGTYARGEEIKVSNIKVRISK